jgi:hypothetical protein
MVGRSKTRRWLARARALKNWQLLVLLLIMIIVSATFLRLNNLGMVERRTAVINADAKGDKEALRASIVELQNYISSHMNTSLVGGLYLSKTYERDRDAALAAAGSTTNPNSAVYQQASIECRQRWKGGVASFRNDYVQCVVEKVGSMAPQSDPTAGLRLPKADAYRINFASPLWTPDIAGLSVLVCVLLVLTILTRLFALVILRLLLRRHYRSA